MTRDTLRLRSLPSVLSHCHRHRGGSSLLQLLFLFYLNKHRGPGGQTTQFYLRPQDKDAGRQWELNLNGGFLPDSRPCLSIASLRRVAAVDNLSNRMMELLLQLSSQKARTTEGTSLFQSSWKERDRTWTLRHNSVFWLLANQNALQESISTWQCTGVPHVHSSLGVMEICIDRCSRALQKENSSVAGHEATRSGYAC